MLKKKTRAKFWLVFIIITLAFANAFPAERDPDAWLYTCVAWHSYTETERLSFVSGWMHGVVAANQSTSEEIMSKLWPRGHRVGSVALEMDVECQKPANRNAALMHVMMQIAKRLNQE
jgi:hypothetical protein